VPVDFTKVSANAFRYALRLADSLDASIDLLHAVPQDDGSLISMSLAAQQVHIAEERLETFFTEGVTAVSGTLQHVPAISPFVVIGGIRAAIRQHVTTEENNLIIMGTHCWSIMHLALSSSFLRPFPSSHCSRFATQQI
jgi:nucleotide-binding universal stress UspA family protein